jgi:hypothetical protein
MLIIQHIWTRWTKASRGANAARARPLLDDAYLLPPMDAGAPVLAHEIGADEWRDFAPIETAGPVTARIWKGWHNMRWRLRKRAVEISLTYPHVASKWPAHLPSPLFILHPGETARIDWNGRFGFGSNHSSYYEQHIYWVAMAEAVEPRLFLDAVPRKHVDLRGDIY